VNICNISPAVCHTPEEWTAFWTFILSLGILFAALTFWWQRVASQVTEAGALLREWSAKPFRQFRYKLDSEEDMEANRAHANEYRNRPSRFDEYEEFLDDVALLTERIEAYIARSVAHELVLAKLLCYDVVSLYYINQDIVKRGVDEENYDYEGWRDLTRRFQDLARINPNEFDMPNMLRWYEFPKLKYRDPPGESKPYKAHLLRRLQAWNATFRHRIVSTRRELAERPGNAASSK
jgi:hypothetical protein